MNRTLKRQPSRKPASRNRPSANAVSAGAIARALHARFPHPRSELDFQSPYELLVAVMLSAQCTDKRVNLTTPELFQRFPSFATLATAPIPELERILRPVNYYRTKAKHLRAAAEQIIEKFRGEIPKTIEELTQLPGVGRKTASVVLGELGLAHTLPVDTHVFRVSHRLGLSVGRNPREVETDLATLFPPESWRSLHHWLILLGRYTCKAQRPLCGECPLRELCPSAHLTKNDRSVRATKAKRVRKRH